MPKHEHTLTVIKEKESECFSCSKIGKVVCIGTNSENYSFRTIKLCHKCLSWLKGKLQGF